MSNQNLECPICRSTMSQITRKESFEYKSTFGTSLLEAMVPVLVCETCLSSFLNGNAEDQNQDTISNLGHSITDEDKCESCGMTDNVTFAPDPYDEDINGDDTPVHLCENCREERAADI